MRFFWLILCVNLGVVWLRNIVVVCFVFLLELEVIVLIWYSLLVKGVLFVFVLFYLKGLYLGVVFLVWWIIFWYVICFFVIKFVCNVILFIGVIK